ncbi:MAG: 50S ribosomal protein L18 [Patescibacteria group bacterium]|nr:50S ribosomal protein L18 [Patescibacteria group bacterium]
MLNNMDINKEKQKRNKRRHNKVRTRVSGTPEKPRFNVYRSNKGMYVQLIDDLSGKTLVSADSKEIKGDMSGKVAVSFEMGKMLAEKAKKKDITKVVFDRGSYNYHGRVKAVAEGAREGGLDF